MQNLLFLLKTIKPTTLQQVTSGKIPNLVLRRMLELFLKIPPLKKMLDFQDWKKTEKFIRKRKLKLEIKPMVENLQNGFYQLENKQAKSAKLGGNVN